MILRDIVKWQKSEISCLAKPKTFFFSKTNCLKLRNTFYLYRTMNTYILFYINVSCYKYFYKNCTYGKNKEKKKI